MQTKVAKMLGVEFPICAFSHCRDVVAAVSNAGGFGILGAVAHSPKRLESELTWIVQQTGKPYGVDLLLPPKYADDDRGGIDGKQARELLPEEHRAVVDQLLIRCGIGSPTDEERRPSGLGEMVDR
jgi:NAD(P)H-dependent flavin oxidoreductase YrpB (nitropropane dioxygenase family)